MEVLSPPVFIFQFLSLPFLCIFTISMSWLAFCPSDACEPFECGWYYLSHPFGKNQSGCGDPALQLECDHDMPLLDINGSQYYILHPQRRLLFEPWDQSHTITIVDKYRWNDGLVDKYRWDGGCTLSPSNHSAQFWSTNSSNQFHIAEGYTTITLLTECGNYFTAFYNQTQLNLGCSYGSDFFTDPNLGPEDCKSLVQLPVNNSEIPSLCSHPKDILRNGFEIHVNLSKNCSDCVSKHGFCIYNTSTLAIIHCNVTSPGKSKIAVPLGCALGGVAVAAVVLLLFIYHVKRRKSTSRWGLSGDLGYYQRNDTEAGLAESKIGTVSIFRYDELEQATNFFHEDNKLGGGGYGSVFLGKLRDGRTMAVKRLYQQNSRRVEQFMNEIQILSSLSHPNLVRLYGCTDPLSPVLLLVYEFIPNGTLADHLHGSRRTPKGLA